jgi:nucleotide-binding universal stress UspA family protein
MSLPIEIARPREQEHLARTEGAMPIRGVLVKYDASPHGRAALHHALGIAREAKLPLTVVSVAAKEPLAGCAQCQANTAFWNRERRSFAAQDLAEAVGLVGHASGVEFAIVEGRAAKALGQAADRAGADVIVLPAEPKGRFRRIVSSRQAQRLRRAGCWTVIVAPGSGQRRREIDQPSEEPPPLEPPEDS